MADRKGDVAISQRTLLKRKNSEMVKVRPFKGLRPPTQIVEKVSCLPYDVMNSEEAARMAGGNEESLLNITRAEICCPKGTDIHSETVYAKAKENFEKAQRKGWLRQDARHATTYTS